MDGSASGQDLHGEIPGLDMAVDGVPSADTDNVGALDLGECATYLYYELTIYL